jgi:hypothetical protein
MKHIIQKAVGNKESAAGPKKRQLASGNTKRNKLQGNHNWQTSNG